MSRSHGPLPVPQTVRRAAGLLLAAVALAAGGGAQLSQEQTQLVQLPHILDTEFEWGDGNIQDVAGTYTTGNGGRADGIRFWVAGGRRRQAWRVNDQTRMLEEENQELFPHSLTAVEVSAADDVLYTGTWRRVYREAIAPDGALVPGVEESWTLQNPAEGEQIRDLGIVEDGLGGEGVVVMTTERLFALEYDPLLPAGGRLVQRAEVALAPILKRMVQMRVHAGPNGDWRAYVMGVIDKPGFANAKPLAKSLCVAELDFPATGAGAFAGMDWINPNHAWNPEDTDSQSAPDGNWQQLQIGAVTGGPFQVGELVTSNQGATATVHEVGPGHVILISQMGSWNAAAGLTGGVSGASAPIQAVLDSKGSSISNMVLENRGPTVYAFLAAGGPRQLTVLDVTGGDSAGFSLLGQWNFQQFLPGINPLLTSLQLVPDWPERLVVVQRSSVHLINTKILPHGPQPAVMVGNFPKNLTLSSLVPKNEHVVFKLPNPGGADEFKLWTAGYSAASFGFALREFTLVNQGGGPGAGVTPSGNMYAFFATDGVVAVPGAIPRATKLYKSYFSGVIQYRVDDPGPPISYVPVIDSALPASPTGSNADISSTEHLALADIGPFDKRLLTDSATGSFLSYQLVGPDLLPAAPVAHDPPPSLFIDLNNHFPPGQEPNWHPSPAVDGRYSNEIAFIQSGGKSYAIYDITNTNGTSPSHNGGAMIGIIARQLDPPPADDLEGWNMAIAQGPPIVTSSKHITVCIDANSDWAVVGYSHISDPGGFAIFDLAGITGNDFDEIEATQIVSVAPFGGVRGIMMNPEKTRIWVSLTAHAADETGGVSVYGFDESTGTVTNGGQPLAKMYQADGDFAPFGEELISAFHLRLGPPLMGHERCYVGTSEGGVFELVYREPDQMTLNGVWHTKYLFNGADDEGYYGEITDLRPFDIGFGPRLYVAKTTESFAVVVPSTSLLGK